MIERKNKIVLKKIRYGLRDIVSHALLADMGFEWVEDRTAAFIIGRMKMYLLGNKIHTEILETITYPKTWIDAVKDRFCPGFLRKIVRIEYQTVQKTVQFTHICPHINWSTERDNSLHFEFMKEEEKK